MPYRTDSTDTYTGQNRENFATSISRRSPFVIVRYGDGQNAHRNSQEGTQWVFAVADRAEVTEAGRKGFLGASAPKMGRIRK